MVRSTGNLSSIDKQCRTQYGSLRNPTSNLHTFRACVINTNILVCIPKITTHPLIGNTSYTIVITFFNIISWSTVSKAFFRSMHIPTVDLQSSIEVVILSTSYNIASDVDIFFLNPY